VADALGRPATISVDRRRTRAALARFATYYLLLATYYSLLTAGKKIYLLLTTYYLLLSAARARAPRWRGLRLKMLLLARTSLLALTTGTRALRVSSVPRMAFQPPARIDAVVSDMDGTLFSFAGRGLSAGSIEALRGCMSNNVHVSLATGRIPGPWHTEVCEQLGPGLGPCVFGNGALVLDEEQRVIWEAQLPEEVISTVLGLTRGGTTAAGGRLCVLAATRWEQEPGANPNPNPNPSPNPDPNPGPNPHPGPDPGPNPDPDPGPNPNQEPGAAYGGLRYCELRHPMVRGRGSSA